MNFSSEPPLLFSSTAHPMLSHEIARLYGTTLSECIVGRFPDGEIKVQVGVNVRGRDVYIIGPTNATSTAAADNLMELCILADAMRRASTARVTAVMSYFGYGRADRKDDSRKPITARLVTHLLQESGVNRFIAIDLHSRQIQGFTDLPFDNLHAGPVLREHIRSLGLDRLYVVGADTGAGPMARKWGHLLGVPSTAADKVRKGDDDVEIREIRGELEGADALIIDDESSTGVTAVRVAEFLVGRKVRSVRFAVVHPKFVAGAVDRITSSPIQQVITSDTVPTVSLPSQFTVCSIAQLLAAGIKGTYEQSSLSDLFEERVHQG